MRYIIRRMFVRLLSVRQTGMSEIVSGRARMSFSTTSPRPHIQISLCCLSIVRVVSFTECQQQVATGSVALFFDNPGYKRCVTALAALYFSRSIFPA